MPLSFETFEFFSPLTAAAKKRLAARRGVALETVQCWGRRPSSDAYPFGTGKANPFDAAKDCLEEQHEQEPGLARMSAAHFVEFVNELSRRAGLAGADAPAQTLRQALREAIKEFSDVELAVLDGPESAAQLKTLRQEIAEAMSSLAALDARVEQRLVESRQSEQEGNSL